MPELYLGGLAVCVCVCFLLMLDTRISPSVALSLSLAHLDTRTNVDPPLLTHFSHFFAAAKRAATTSKSMTFQIASTYFGRTFWYCR